MPIRKTTSPNASNLESAHPELYKQLKQEWANPQNKAKQPLIIEEAKTSDQPIHLYVVWDKWADLDQETRSEIIISVYENVKGTEASLMVTVAMGLTTAEAKRMNIEL